MDVTFILILVLAAAALVVGWQAKRAVDWALSWLRYGLAYVVWLIRDLLFWWRWPLNGDAERRARGED